MPLLRREREPAHLGSWADGIHHLYVVGVAEGGEVVLVRAVRVRAIECRGERVQRGSGRCRCAGHGRYGFVLVMLILMS